MKSEDSLDLYFSAPRVVADTKKNWKTKFRKPILPRFSIAYQISYLPMVLQKYSLNYPTSQFTIDNSAQGKKFITPVLTATIIYRLRHSYSIGISSTSTFSRNKIDIMDVYFSKAFNLNPNGRPIHIIPSIQAGSQKIHYYLQNVKTSKSFTVEGKRFDSGSTDVFLATHSLRIQPSVNLSIEKNHRLSFQLSGGYILPFLTKNGLLLNEAKEFYIKRKKVFLDDDTASAKLTHDGNTLLKNQFSVSAGLHLNLVPIWK